MKVLVVIVTFNRIELLKRSIESVRANQPFGIIVINNGSTDGTKEWLDSQPDLMKHVFTFIN